MPKYVTDAPYSATGDGVAYDDAAFAAWIADADEGDVMIAPEGKVYRLQDPMSIICPKHAKFIFYGDLFFDSIERSEDALTFDGDAGFGTLEITRLRGVVGEDLSLNTNNGLVVKNVVTGMVKVEQIYYFDTALKVLGQGTGKGTYYTEIHLRKATMCRRSVLITSDDMGFVNDNHFYVKFMDTDCGLESVSPATPNDWFNGNKFYGLGCEGNATFGIKLTNARNNIFYSPRLEQGKQGLLMQGGWIDEDLTNQSNHFFIDLPIYKKAFSNQNGKMSEVHGHIMDNSGKILGRGKINNWKGQGSYITP